MIKLILLVILIPVLAFYGGFMLGGLIFAIYKEIRAIYEDRNAKK
jgi:hypothetical protein